MLPAGRGVHLVAEPLDDDAELTSGRSAVVVRFWRETSSVIRGSLTHGSGAIALFQGGNALLEIAQFLQLDFKHCE